MLNKTLLSKSFPDALEDILRYHGVSNFFIRKEYNTISTLEILIDQQDWNTYYLRLINTIIGPYVPKSVTVRVKSCSLEYIIQEEIDELMVESY